MQPQLADRIRSYGQRVDAAETVLREQHGFSEAKISVLRDGVNSEIERVHACVLAATGRQPTFETWDEVEYSDAYPAAEAFLLAEQITDPIVVKAVRNFVWHHAALKLQLEIEDMRDMEDAESVGGADTWDDDILGDGDD